MFWKWWETTKSLQLWLSWIFTAQGNDSANQRDSQTPWQSSIMSLPCGSTRHQKPPGEWWKALTAHLTNSWDLSLSHQIKSAIERKMTIGTFQLALKWILCPKTKLGFWCQVESQKPAKHQMDIPWKVSVTPDDNPYVKYKARFVIHGFQKLEGIDYEEIYAAFVKFATLGYFLAKLHGES